MEGTPSRTPKEKAGFLALLTFSWMHNVLKLGRKQPLEEKHLFPVETSNQAERLVADLEGEWQAEERASEQNRTKPRPCMEGHDESYSLQSLCDSTTD